jgi:hypothetical protein
MLHETDLSFEADALLSMLKDVVDGMLFLHQHVPIMMHGRLSSQVLLVLLSTILALSETPLGGACGHQLPLQGH